MADKQTVNIHGKEYETVASRINRFRDEHKQAFSIVTQIVSNDGEYVVMKAAIADKDSRVIATGYAQEKYGAGNINQTSALENCETSAIGRALAAFGMGGTEFASADEVATAIKQQGEGVKYSPKKASPNKPASDKQKKLINDLYRQKVASDESLIDWLGSEFGVVAKEMDGETASGIIEEMMAMDVVNADSIEAEADAAGVDPFGN